jgi:DNA modification methylase
MAAEMKIELWDIDRPKDYPGNARKWSGRAIDKVGTSIKTYGWRQPIVVDKHEVIVIGHLRRTAGRSIGETQCPVHVAHDLTATQIRGLRLADNRTNEESDWDIALLAAEFGELQALDFDLTLTGFDAREIDAFTLQPNAAEDDVPPVPATPVSRLGDLWLCGSHRVLCGSATSESDVARLLEDRKPFLMITDPPYGIELDSEWRDRAGLNGHLTSNQSGAARKAKNLADPANRAEPSYMKHRTAGHNETSISGDTVADWSPAFDLVPSLQIAYVWHASKYTSEVLAGLLRIGFVHHQQIIWDKTRTVLTRTLYWFQHEPCWFVRKKNAPWYGKAGENSTIWACPSPKFFMGKKEEEKYDHPTQKPVELMRKPLLNHTKRGELVYEPFLGSGTTLAAAEVTERVCCGMEIDPKYVDVVVSRWQTLSNQEARLEGDGRTFAEIKAERMNG